MNGSSNSRDERDGAAGEAACVVVGSDAQRPKGGHMEDVGEVEGVSHRLQQRGGLVDALAQLRRAGGGQRSRAGGHRQLHGSPAAFAQASASSASADARSTPARRARAPRCRRAPCERTAGSPRVLARASASAMTAGCSRLRPSGHMAPALTAEHADAQRGGRLGAGLAQRLVDRTRPHPRSDLASSQYQPSAAPTRAQTGRRPARAPTRTRRGGSRSPGRAGQVLVALVPEERRVDSVCAGRPRGSSGGGARGPTPGRRAPRTRSAAYSRIVSSIAQPRRSVARCRRRTSRLLATSRSSVSMLGAGDRLRRLDRRAAGEHREAREARLLVLVEQVVAPVDRRAQRLLARGRVARRRARARRARRPGGRRSRAGDSSPQRAAASSIASGSPSRRRQISATAAALPSLSSKSGSCARARSTNSATASTPASVSGSSGVPGSGSASGGTG